MSLRAVAGSQGTGPSGTNITTDPVQNVSGTSYTLAQTPAGAVMQIYLDGILQLPANYSVTGATVTFTGLTMSNYSKFQATYSY